MLIVVKVKPKLVTPFRVVMTLLALPWVYDCYDMLESGVAVTKHFTYLREEDPLGFYLTLARSGAFAFLFGWLATGGVKASSSISEGSENGGADDKDA